MRRRDLAICLLFGLVSFLIYNANLRPITAADTYGARYLPFAIWHDRTVVLDPIVKIVAQGRKTPAVQGIAETAFWIAKGRDGHFVSLYPIVVPVVLAPLYLPAVAYLHVIGWDPIQLDKIARIMEKLCASLLAAATVMLLYQLLRRRSDPATAAMLTLVFAFGTTTWVISSQALWMHGLAQLLIVGTMLLLTGQCTPIRAGAAGFLCALIACNRQPDAILAAGLAIYGLWWAKRELVLFFAAGVLPVVLTLAYNLGLVGYLAGAYTPYYSPGFLSDNWAVGVAGLLFSPTRGLFVFSPFLLFLPFCIAAIFRDRTARWLTAAVAGAVILQIAFYGLADWRQGISWGPRWLTDMLPMLFWMLPPVVAALSYPGRAVFGGLCCAAIAIEVVGAFWYAGTVDKVAFTGGGPDRLQPMWDIRNTQFIAELSHPPVAADLVVDPRGNIDLVRVHHNEGGKAGRHVEVQGWALTNGRSPAGVFVLIDGRFVAGTTTFFERADVVRALNEKRPSGWKLAFPADDLVAGEHVVAVVVQAHARGETRLLKERAFTLAAEIDSGGGDRDLAEAARHAIKMIVARQQTLGYWLTDFTPAPRFEQPSQELNTFLNALMIDVLAPVADKAGISDTLARARAFLTRQIEPGGLVRYHGLPDAPTIGQLGCAITPDADDTALAWRVAPGEDRSQLTAALATLREFRTADGLYRTWLAPRDRYQCLDPGKDPDPADIVIQFHVLMLLAQADPAAAVTLCDALRKRVDDESLWVYYQVTPLIAILRLPDLRSSGCPLQLPPARFRTSVSGQELWVDAFERLEKLDNSDDRAGIHSETVDLLRKIAADNFSLLAHNPPLLYHNDFTATVPRFYWSEELGYALWLRLYFENERARP